MKWKLPWHRSRKPDPVEPTLPAGGTGALIWDRAAQPDRPETAVFAVMRSWVEQKAIVDARNKSDDAASILRMRHLSGEDEIRQFVDVQREISMQQAQQQISLQRVLTRNRIASGHDGRSASTLQQYIDDQKKTITGAQRERESATQVLTGARPDPWGRNMTAPVPLPGEKRFITMSRIFEIVAWLGEVLATIAVAVSAFGGGRIAEASILQWAMMIGFMLLAASVLLAAPIWIGDLIRGSIAAEGERRNRAGTMGVVVLLVVLWVVTIIAIALARVRAVMLTEKGVVLADVNAAFNGPLAMLKTLFEDQNGLLFLAIFSVAGIIIIVIHATHNPYIDAVVAADRKIARARADYEGYVRERDLTEQEIAAARDAEQDTEITWKRRANEAYDEIQDSLIAEYRDTYKKELKDLDVTTALELLEAEDDRGHVREEGADEYLGRNAAGGDDVEETHIDDRPDAPDADDARTETSSQPAASDDETDDPAESTDGSAMSDSDAGGR
jgi:hypothetical protein